MRKWLIDIPAFCTDLGLAWYRLYVLILLGIGALVLPLMALMMLALRLAGIRWGW